MLSNEEIWVTKLRVWLSSEHMTRRIRQKERWTTFYLTPEQIRLQAFCSLQHARLATRGKQSSSRAGLSTLHKRRHFLVAINSR